MQQDDLREDLKTGSKEFLFSFPAIFCIYLEHRKYGLCHLPYPFPAAVEQLVDSTVMCGSCRDGFRKKKKIYFK
jgi:hypothetical protein